MYLIILLTLVIILISYYFWFKEAQNVVVLAGLSDSGKTAIFSVLVFGKVKQSVTSMKENEATIKKYNLKLVDLPGSGRLRQQYWDKFKTKARHIIFVVDSTTVESNLAEIGEYLGTLLEDVTRCTIACNKQDLESAASTESVEKLIRDELKTLKKATLKEIDFIGTSIHNVEQLIKKMIQ